MSSHNQLAYAGGRLYVGAYDGQSRERFQKYIVDLAAEHEQECAVMDHEAQRCRGILAKQPQKTEKKK